MTPRKIMLVKPAFAHLLQNDAYRTFPLGLMTVASMLQSRGHEVLIWHADVSSGVPIPKKSLEFTPMHQLDTPEIYATLELALDEWQPDVVGISCVTADSLSAYHVAALCKARGIRTVGGGVHPSLCTEEARQHFDCVVVGEGDTVVAATAFEDHSVSLVQPPLNSNLDEFLPAREAVIGWQDYPEYLRGFIQTQRGCVYNCGYCAAPKVFGSRIRTRTAESVGREVAGLGVHVGRIVDDAFGVLQPHSIEVCNELSKLRYRWVCDIAIQDATDVMLEHMARGGCMQINLGIESGTERWRALSGKRVQPGDPERVLSTAQSMGMRTLFYFMMGFPGETYEEVTATLDMAEALKDRGAAPCISVVTPSPRTKLWDLAMGTREQGDVPWSEFIHQSAGMGFADVTVTQWAALTKRADRINA